MKTIENRLHIFNKISAIAFGDIKTIKLVRIVKIS